MSKKTFLNYKRLFTRTKPVAGVGFSLSPKRLYSLFFVDPAKLFYSTSRKTPNLTIVRKCVPWNWRHGTQCWKFTVKPSGTFTNH